MAGWQDWERELEISQQSGRGKVTGWQGTRKQEIQGASLARGKSARKRSAGQLGKGQDGKGAREQVVTENRSTGESRRNNY